MTHSALVRVSPLLALRVVRHPLALLTACSALILALLLLLAIHLPGCFLRRFLRLFSHLHSVLSEGDFVFA
ncbi:hypothetical protein OG874_26945 [Nocardia sp. NBC_00565]|uniref:hypothetical protein n=1 Tax=Nocardia sp. NBC_00565 TaxID=2975993 RepID=UPI002E7FEA3C|nr:hypothetical protein [Nocardia sp. NBC_00565]WUC00504.1 hypothetical protein OG874_26945 [Nocardia sp. NBC_00565]